MAKITVNEALGLIKTIRERHTELVSLRAQNSARETRYFGANADKQTESKPVYDVRKLDLTCNRLALEARKLDNLIKQHNATATLDGYDWDESILGVIETETA